MLSRALILILASLFRQHAAPLRSQGPSTAYPSGLQPVASTNDINGNKQIHRRVSRTDLDFEQALQAEGTFVLREGVDVNTLGVDSSPGLNRSFGSPSSSSATPVNRAISRIALQPSTPIVVPPTPLHNPGSSTAAPSSSRLSASNGGGGSSFNLASVGPSPSSSSHDLGADAEEAERQTNRRSMYRSPGTSSSPDLATLLRKAKERGAPVATQKRDKKRDDPPPPPLPDQASRQPTSSHSYSSATLVASPSFASGEGTGSPEWVFASPNRHKANGTVKVRNSFLLIEDILIY